MVFLEFIQLTKQIGEILTLFYTLGDHSAYNQ